MIKEDFEGLIIGNFKIKKKIGDGAYSMVFLAEEINSQNGIKYKRSLFSFSKKTYVACKILPRQKVEQKKLSIRLDQEIRIHQLMHHPNVLQMIDILKDSSFYYVFLEFCPCGALFDLVVQKSKLKEVESAIFIKQILLGLQYIHSMNVAHRDLKPENILIDQFGTVKIADFGLSKLLSYDSDGLTKTPCGSPCYASPEVLGHQPYDCKKSDIWSCGVILFTITTGHLPWTCRTHSKLFEQIKKGQYKVPQYVSYCCADLICKLMTVDNSERITIEDALNHPFLKNVELKIPILNFKVLSLRKVDRVLGADEYYEYYGIFDDLSNEIKPNCDSSYQLNFFKIRKSIESEEEKKKKREKIDKISSVVRSRNTNVKNMNKTNRNACIIKSELDSEEENNEEKSKKSTKKKRNKKANNPIDQNISSPINSVAHRKNRRLNLNNQYGAPSLAPRRSEANPLLYI